MSLLRSANRVIKQTLRRVILAVVRYADVEPDSGPLVAGVRADLDACANLIGQLATQTNRHAGLFNGILMRLREYERVDKRLMQASARLKRNVDREMKQQQAARDAADKAKQDGIAATAEGMAPPEGVADATAGDPEGLSADGIVSIASKRIARQAGA